MTHYLKSIFMLAIWILSYPCFGQIGVFNNQTIIGTSAKSSFAYHAPEQAYYFQPYERVSAKNVHFVWKNLRKNFFVSGRIIEKPSSSFVPGLMLRSKLTRQSDWAALVYNNTDELCLVNGTGTKSDTLHKIKLDAESFPLTVRLEKLGGTLTGYYGENGEPMKTLGEMEYSKTGSILGGLMTTTQKAPVTSSIKWDNVRITVPFEESQEYRQVKSRIEIMDIETGHREIIFEAPRQINTPTWSSGGNYLIVNSNGELQKLSLDGGALKKVNTGKLRGINNDHGISPDGEKLVISHQKEGLHPAGTSTISLMPMEGGEIKTVTSKTPSYWHGWSPDGQTITYVGNRKEDFDIFTVSIDGLGKEKKLTTYDGLDDGPDFSAEGKYIYFCSERTGDMKIWRMAPDGANKEQITYDEYQDWFPHPSPDGKFIVFMSYEPDVPSGEHPPNRKVMLRVKEYNKDTPPQTKGYLYGGQGTINVPSWSPDGKYVAFASYTFQ